jgi:hypothetical protein
MRNKKFEKILERRKKAKEADQIKIEQLDLDNLYTNRDGTIDWNRLAEHIREATSGR